MLDSTFFVLFFLAWRPLSLLLMFAMIDLGNRFSINHFKVQLDALSKIRLLLIRAFYMLIFFWIGLIHLELLLFD